MKIKNIDLINISNILASFNDYKLPQKISYAIVKNVKMLEKDVEIYNNMLTKILKAYEPYVLKDDNGEPKKTEIGIPAVDEEHEDDLYNEINELLETEINVTFFSIPEEVFDYEESDRYDVLSSKEIINLQNILCNHDGDDKDENVD